MAKGGYHSTGTICKAEKICPLEATGEHFDSVGELVAHTASETGADRAELQSVIDSGVAPAEAVTMAKEGLIGKATADSAKKPAKALKPAEVKELSQFDPSVHSVFSNGAARTNPDIAARALKREIAAEDWANEQVGDAESYAQKSGTLDDDDRAFIEQRKQDAASSRARQAAMAQEMRWLADNDSSYAAQLPSGARGLLDSLKGSQSHGGASIGTVKKAPAKK